MAFSVVQSKSANSSAALVTTISATLDAAPTSGNLLIVALALNNGSAGLTVPDGWTTVINQSSTPSFVVFYKIAGASESPTISMSWTTARRAVIEIREYPAGTVDKTAASNSSGSAVASKTSGTTGALTSAPQFCLAYFAVGSWDSAAGTNATFSNSFANKLLIGAKSGATPWIASVDKEVATTDAVETTMTFNAQSDEASGCIITIVAPPLTAGAATVTNRTGSSVEVSWTGASGGVDPIVEQLQISETGAEDWDDVTGATSSPGTATGLDDDTEYDFRVRYTDDDAEVVYSEIISATTSNVPLVVITDQNGATSGIVTVMGPGQATFHCTASLLGAGRWSQAKMEWGFGDPSGRYNTLRGFSAAHFYDVEPESNTDYTVTCTITNTDGESAFATRTVRVTPNTRTQIYVDPDDGSSTPVDPSDPEDPYDTIANAWAGEATSNLEIIITAGKTHAMTVALEGNGTNDNVLLRSSIKGTKATIAVDSIGMVVGEANNHGIRDIHFAGGILTATGCRIIDPRYTSNDPGIGNWAVDITSADDYILASTMDDTSGATLLLNVQTDDISDTGNLFFSGPMVTVLGCNLRHAGTERPFRGDGDYILIHDTIGRYNNAADKTAITRHGGDFLYISECEFINETAGGVGNPMHLGHTTSGPGPDPQHIVVEKTLCKNEIEGQNEAAIVISPNLQGAIDVAIRNVICDNGRISVDTRSLDDGRIVQELDIQHVTITLDHDRYINLRGADHLDIRIENILAAGTATGPTAAIGDTADDFATEGLVVNNNIFPVAGTPSEDATVYDGSSADESWTAFNARNIAAGNLAKAITLDGEYRPTNLEDEDLLVAPPSSMELFAEDYYGNPRSGDTWIVGAVGSTTSTSTTNPSFLFLMTS